MSFDQNTKCVGTSLTVNLSNCIKMNHKYLWYEVKIKTMRRRGQLNNIQNYVLTFCCIFWMIVFKHLNSKNILILLIYINPLNTFSWSFVLNRPKNKCFFILCELFVRPGSSWWLVNTWCRGGRRLQASRLVSSTEASCDRGRAISFEVAADVLSLEAEQHVSFHHCSLSESCTKRRMSHWMFLL